MQEPLINELINHYRISPLKKRDALREILQQAALLGLARTRFFEHAAFYGGTALRILYGLDRFSEDMDFSLLKADPHFNFDPFLEGMKRELNAFGFSLEVERKEKNHPSPIQSAFLKGNTLKLLLTLDSSFKNKEMHPEEKIKIKLEIDTTPPTGFSTESKLVLTPVPFYVLSYKKEDLFAGKMHALLFRERKINVKGRDWFDLIWFIKNHIPLNITHLSYRMHDSGNLAKEEMLDKAKLDQLLDQKIASVDWNQAKIDVKGFLTDTKQLDLWSAPFFKEVVSRLTCLE